MNSFTSVFVLFLICATSCLVWSTPLDKDAESFETKLIDSLESFEDWTDDSDPLIVTTDKGPVKGFISQVGSAQARVFRGIRYAKPPQRWSDPQEPDNWTTLYDATQYGAGCAQLCALPHYGCPHNVSEDCLFLNVYTPVPETISAPLPVLFWIHGGHFEYGSGEGPLYEATTAVNLSSTVIVTINYRLGALGWLYLSDAQSNFGLKDQFMALEWVQRNIAAFGGDPGRVTISGQSAGGTSVASMMVTPYWAERQNGLPFVSVVMQSNPLGLPVVSPAEGLDLLNRFAQDVNCNPSDLNCLRSVPLTTLLVAQKKAGLHVNISDIFQTFYPWSPALGSLVPDHPLRLFMQGKFAKVPLVLGTVEEEGRLFIWEAVPVPIPAWEFDTVLITAFGLKNALTILKYYPPVGGGVDNRALLGQVVTDYLFACPARAVARASAASGTPTYEYRFNHSFTYHGAWSPDWEYCEDHVCHAEELPFVFIDVYSGIFNFTASEDLLARQMSSAWTSFAAKSAPNTPGWLPYTAASDNTFLFTDPPSLSRPIFHLRQAFCDMWDSIGYHF